MTSTRIVIVVILLVLSSAAIRAQAPGIEWDYTYGEPNSNEYGKGAYSTPYGCYIAGGMTRREGDYDCLLIKFTDEGDTLWTRSTGAPGCDETIVSFHILPNGYYMTAGAINLEGEVKAHIMSMNPDGFHDWSGYFSSEEHPEYAYDVAPDVDSGYVYAGTKVNGDYGTDINLVHLTYMGGPQWGMTYAYENAQTPYCVQAIFGGGYIVVGETQDPVYFRNRGLIYKANNLCYPIVINSVGSGGDVRFSSVKQLPDSGFIIAGTITHDEYDDPDVIVMSTTASTAEVWTKIYGFDGSDGGMSVDPTPDGGFIVGATCEFGSMNFWALRLDADGDTLWTKICGTSRAEYLRSISLTNDGGYIMCGDTQEHDNPYRYDMYVVKLEPDPMNFVGETSPLPRKTALLQNYPNPFNAKTKIKFQLNEPSDITLTLYDILGQELRTLASGNYQAGTHSVSFDASGLASGTYLYKLQTENSVDIKKMTLIK